MFFRAVAFGLVLSGTLLVAQDAKTSSDEFYAAIRANELARVSALIKQGADLNAKDSRGNTPVDSALGKAGGNSRGGQRIDVHQDTAELLRKLMAR